jgi:hypothetical protein
MPLIWARMHRDPVRSRSKARGGGDTDIGLVAAP